MGRQRFSAFYMWGVIAIGTAVVLFSLYRLPFERLDLPYLILALLVLAVSSSVVIRIPLVSGGITVSDTFIFLTLLLYGGEPAVLLALGDGLFSSLRISRKPRTILFNSAVMACAMFLTTWTLRACFGSIIELPRAGYTSVFIGAIWVMALTQYVANSGLVAAEKSFLYDLASFLPLDLGDLHRRCFGRRNHRQTYRHLRFLRSYAHRANRRHHLPDLQDVSEEH
jgi:hypothetical protein